MRKISSLIFFFLCAVYCHAQNWKALNPPLNIFNGAIYATAMDALGNVYAAGDFKDVNNNHFVAKWNGTSWAELGSGSSALNANGTILTMAATSNEIYAAGSFTDSAGYAYVAKWNGTSWSELGEGDSALKVNGFIYSVTVDKAGNVYAAGGFMNSAGHAYVAKWNGSSWSELGNGTNALDANNAIFAITVDASKNIYAGGYFTDASGKEYVAKWDGNAWSATGTGTAALNANDFISCLAADNNGNIYAGGSFRNDSSKYYLAKWNGTTWSETGTGTNALNANSNINSIVVKSANEIYAAGDFTDGVGIYYVAKWNGTSWLEVDSAQGPLLANNQIQSIQVDANNNIYAGGKFTNESGHQFIARWNGSVWNEPGSKGDPFYSSQPIYKVVGDTSGNVFVSGYLMDNGGSYYIEHWNGSGWNQLQPDYTAGLNIFLTNSSFSENNYMKVDKAGNLYITGRHQISVDSGYDCVLKWDGKAWNILEDFPNALNSYNENSAYNDISEIETDAQGNVYAVGNFNPAAVKTLSKWDGTRWSYLTQPNGGIQKLCIGNDGTLYAFGSFYLNGETYSVGELVNGNWQEVKNGNSKFKLPVNQYFLTMAINSTNNLYVNGEFTDSAGNRYLQKWDGNNWSEFGITNSLNQTLAVAGKTVYSSGAATYSGDCAVKTWNGNAWVGLGAPLEQNEAFPYGSIVSTNYTGNVYSDALSNEPGVGSFIVKYETRQLQPPNLSSFTPTSGSLGTNVTISGKNLNSIDLIKFGGTNASSFTIINDTTVTAIVGEGSTGSVLIETPAGADSLQTFTYTCDSINGLSPSIYLYNDTTLLSLYASYYRWYFNNIRIENANSRSLPISKAGFYRVETSSNNICWLTSMDYPVIIAQSPFADSLKMNIYPNPSSGKFTADVTLPETTTVTTYVTVYDVNGLKVLQTNKLIFFGNEIKIPLQINTKGTYFIKVHVNNDAVQQTVIIM